VFRSNCNTYAQAVDDVSRRTIAAGDTRTISKGVPVQKAAELGRMLGKVLKEKGIERAVFDRGGYRYHGRVRAVAEGLRESGISI
jgi:large subunit ribosomal protein L18